MKKNQVIVGILATALMMVSCNSNETTENQEGETESQTEVTSEESETEITMSVEEIDQYRSEIESLKIAPMEVMTSNARAKIKQKWSKMHFYVDNNEVVKVKTYPYSEVSNRTEEFYVKDGELVLAVIEDDGSGMKGKAKSDLDKLYYFNNGKLIEEIKKDEKSEYTIKESDPEELLSEFAEYLEMYQKQSK